MHVLATRCVGLKRIASEVTSFSSSFPFSFPTLPRASFDGNISERSIRSINPLLLYETLISCAPKARSGLLRSPLSAAVLQDSNRGSPIWGAALFSSFCTFFFSSLSRAQIVAQFLEGRARHWLQVKDPRHSAAQNQPDASQETSVEFYSRVCGKIK